jgi:hypothetical protein
VTARGEVFRLARAPGTVSVQALRRGDVVERLSARAVTGGRRVVAVDRSGLAATYTGRVHTDPERGRVVVTDVESGGRTYRAVAAPQEHHDRLTVVLHGTELPRLLRIPRLARAVREGGTVLSAPGDPGEDAALPCALAGTKATLPVSLFVLHTAT